VSEKRRIAIAIEIDQPYPHHQDIFLGVQRYAQENRQWQCVIDEHPGYMARRRRHLPPYDGVIARANPAMQNRLKRQGTPFVNVHYQSIRAGTVTVCADPGKMGQMAAEHLIDQGFPRLLVLFPLVYRFNIMVAQAFESHAEELGVPCSKQNLVEGVYRDPSSWLELETAILANLDEVTPPVGILATNPSVARLIAQHALSKNRPLRGYAARQFTLFNAIAAADSSYVCRLRDNSRYEVLEERPLSEAALEANVLQDAVVELGTQHQARERPDHPLRLVTIKIKPHVKRGKYQGGSTGPGSDGTLRIATNLLDVPAEVIALIYEYRWTIEVFFRFFKHVLGCRHLISHSQNGIEIQTYCAIIACMLISLWTGRKPTLRTYEMICYYFSGLADEEELIAHIAKLKPHDA
jgi:hypothetical protein